MKILVYFASGPYKAEYQNLKFDRIILVDNCFKKHNKIFINRGKVTCIGMDCLDSIKYLKTENIKIDCFVSLNEGLAEGGGRYAINSDFFLGYVMPILKDTYVHIMNRNYYGSMYRISMDWPFNMVEISSNEEDFISPFIFSKNSYHEGHAKNYRMERIHNKRIILLNPNLEISINHDSIWNDYDDLDLIAISFSQQGQGDFFDKLPKTINLNTSSIGEVFSYCKLNKIEKIGLTPWGKGKYSSFINLLRNFNEDYPKEIRLFHLNKKDYKEIREYAARG